MHEKIKISGSTSTVQEPAAKDSTDSSIIILDDEDTDGDDKENRSKK